ncbi:MAG: riboflavin kinase [bacterium]|nr:riboflavin kinase [bacterium]
MIHKAVVISGQGRGRRIGFPTINLEIPEGLGATHGIYAGWIYIHGQRHPAAIHYGPIPTFQEVSPTLEAHVLDGQIENVPHEVEFELVGYIRDIKMFLNAEELAVAIAGDIEDVERILRNK